jgi:hypothetical protein
MLAQLNGQRNSGMKHNKSVIFQRAAKKSEPPKSPLSPSGEEVEMTITARGGDVSIAALV